MFVSLSNAQNISHVCWLYFYLFLDWGSDTFVPLEALY